MLQPYASLTPTQAYNSLDGILQQLEAMCGTKIPAEYIEIIRNFPEHLRDLPRSESGDESEGLISQVEFIASLNDVLEINKEVRHGSIVGPDGQLFEWPEQLLVIGENGEGDYYCIDTDEEHDGVLQYRHHTLEFEQISESMDEFIELLTEAFCNDYDP